MKHRLSACTLYDQSSSINSVSNSGHKIVSHEINSSMCAKPENCRYACHACPLAGVNRSRAVKYHAGMRFSFDGDTWFPEHSRRCSLGDMMLLHGFLVLLFLLGWGYVITQHGFERANGKRGTLLTADCDRDGTYGHVGHLVNVMREWRIVP